MEIVFCTVPMMGHLMPLIPYASELHHQRGHKVVFVHDDDPKYRQKLDSCGLGSCESITYNASNENESMYDAILSYYNGKSTKPDVIVYDFFAVDGADAADKLGDVPAIGVFPNPRSVNPWAASIEEQQTVKWNVWCKCMWGMESIIARMLWCGRNYQRWTRNLSMLPEQDLYPSPYMPRHIIGCTSSIIEFPNLPEASKFYMVGPSLPPVVDPMDTKLKEWLNAHRSKRIVYVAFGTMYKYTKSNVQHLEKELMSFDDTDIAIIWSLPKQYQCWLSQKQHTGELPSDWYVHSFLPQVSLLQSGKVDAFVTHCGSNSVYEALLSGVPMICCPGMADQPANATRLARLGVGVIARDGKVGEAFKHLLLNEEEYDKFRMNSSNIASQLKSNDSAIKAATLIEQIARGDIIDDIIDDIDAKKRIPWWPAAFLLTLGATVALA